MTPIVNDFQASISSRLGPYRIIRLVGHGGMGAVYVAHDARLERDVAIKVMLASGSDSIAGDALRRFEREMRAQARLSHPNIVKILDVGIDDTIHYFAMELLTGCTLRETIDRAGPLPATRVVSIGARLADALAHMHAQGMVHRDIKPQNIFIRGDGEPILMDLGLVKIEGGTILTEAGSLLATPRYLAPEVVLGQPADTRCDIYQLGLVLYEAATKRNAFDAPQVQALLAAILSGPITPPHSLNAAISKPLSDLILRAMHRSRALRVPDATTLARALERQASPREGGAPLAAARVRGMRADLPTPQETPASGPSSRASPAAPPPRPRQAMHIRKALAVAGILVTTAGAYLLGVRSHHSASRQGPPAPGGLVRERNQRTVRGGAAGSPRPLQSASVRPAGVAPVQPATVSAIHPPGYWTGGWEPYRALLPRLKAGGATAERAVQILRKAMPVDFGLAPAMWAYWLQLNLWLHDQKGPWPPADLARGYLAGLDPDLREAGEVYAAHPLTHSTLDAYAVEDAYGALWAQDGYGRRWLILGRLLELDGRMKDAHTVYTLALNRLRGQRLEEESWLVWDGLTRALLACAGEDHFAGEMVSYLGGEPDPRSAWQGIYLALVQKPMFRSRFARLLAMAKDDPRLGAGDYRWLGEFVLSGQGMTAPAPETALQIWKRGLDRFPRDQPLLEKFRKLQRVESSRGR